MPWYKHLLWPLAVMYGAVVGIRNFLFDYRVLRQRKFKVPIICVGNLEAGGTGKSPLVQYIVRVLTQNGRNVAVVSRGYGRASTGLVQVNENHTALQVGDEPLQLKRRHPEVTVIVCGSRVKAITHLLQSAGAPHIIVMDDGFQHRWVKPSLSILATPKQFPFWKNYLLPVGTLREAKTNAQRADILVQTGAASFKPTVGPFSGKTFVSVSKASALVQFNGATMPVSYIKSVVLFSGIANAYRFKDSVAECYAVCAHLKFADHHNYTSQDLSKLRNLDSFGAAANAVVTTEKDAARLANTDILKELEHVPMFYLPISVEFGAKTAEFNQLIIDHGKHA